MSDAEACVSIRDAAARKNERNALILGPIPKYPVIVISNCPLYYSPADVFRLVRQFGEHVKRIAIFISDLSPYFVLLLGITSVELTTKMLENARSNPPSSLDNFRFDYLDSFELESVGIQKALPGFLNGRVSAENCAICLNACAEKNQLCTFACGHTIHTKCLAGLPQWSCPVCRYSFLLGLGSPGCVICGTSDKIYTCLICRTSFCYEHCNDHYRDAGHAYFVGSDGLETWNLMTGSCVKRVAYDKEGELVEMCAKEDNMITYMEQAITQQVVQTSETTADMLQIRKQQFEDWRRDMEQTIEQRKREIKEMKELIEGHEKRERVIIMLQNVLKSTEERRNALREENPAHAKRNRELRAEIAELHDLVDDLRNNAAISTALAMTGSNQRVILRY